jgi:hypothetical protein
MLETGVSRRGFLKNASYGLAAAAAVGSIPKVHAAEGPELEVKIGLIGCGGRGTGAVLDAVGAATRVIYPATGYHTEDVAEGASIERENIRVVALADLFQDRLGPLPAAVGEAGAGRAQAALPSSASTPIGSCWTCRRSTT